MNFFNYKNLVINLSNVFIFITIQMIFFYYIISRINIKVFEKKLIYIKPFLNSIFKNVNIDKKDLQNTKNHNINLILTRVGPILLGLLLNILGLFVLNNVKGKKWTSYEIKLLLFVILAFSTEVIIFFLVINKYDFIKIGSILNYIINNVDKNTLPKIFCDMFLKDTKYKDYNKTIKTVKMNKTDINNIRMDNNLVDNNLVDNNLVDNNLVDNNNLVYEFTDFIPDNNYYKF